MKYCTSIGIDTHEKTNSICAIDRQTGEETEDMLPAEPKYVISWIKAHNFEEPVRCVYEAGPTGFGLARALIAAGIECVVAATSKLPQRIDRQKNDRIDAEWLARMLDAGSVRAVYIPTEAQESLMHLSRLRAETSLDLRRAKQRVASFLLQTHTSYTLTKKRWTKTFDKWASSYEFNEPEDTFVFREKVGYVFCLEDRLMRIEDEIRRVVKGDEMLINMMARLEAIHGIGFVTAFSLVVEVYDFTRFKKASAFASFVGLIPSEYSSGKNVSYGTLAKCGNSNLRRLLMEVVSIYSRPKRSVTRHRDGVPEPICRKADKCSDRLYKRRRYLVKRGLHANKVKAALARELCEWIWWIATEKVAA